VLIYEKSVSFIRPNPKFGAKLAVIIKNEHFNQDFGTLVLSLFSTPNLETVNT
jgi:hypothetical protein